MKQRTFSCLTIFFFVVIFGSSCSKTEVKNSVDRELSKTRSVVKFSDNLSNQVILDWNLAALEAEGGVTYANPLFASRTDAMVHIAMHDALNAVEPVYEQYTAQGRIAEADPVLAAAQAAHTVLVNIYPDKKDILDALLAKYLALTPDGIAEQKAVTKGQEAGMAIISLRQNDGAAQNPIGPAAVSNVPGEYNTVPPFTFVFAEFWKNVPTFSLESSQQFRVKPPPGLTSMEYTKDFNEVKEIGGLTSSTRSDEQSFYARFWYEFIEIGWNRIARIVATDQNMGLWATARLFALMNMAATDAYIAGWDSKFYYNFWRPYTAIRAAELDGNSRTLPDASWQSFLLTPPIPDYPSTHSVGGNAAATVLTLLTTGNTSFTTTSSTSLPFDAPRTFRSFKQAADENADSRVIAGIHFRFAAKAGQDLGDAIGRWTVKNHLEPLKGSVN